MKTTAKQSALIQKGLDWYAGRNWEAFPFQIEMMKQYLKGKSGILNAPTGSGKTFAMWIPVLLGWINKHPGNYREKKKNGLQVLWITPLRALSKDIVNANQEACVEMEIPWRVEARTGDTSSAIRQRQMKNMPECLVTTPESLHILIANKNHRELLASVQTIVVDEWHELLGSKRGVQVELAIARLRTINPALGVWGISATIGNLQEAVEVLLGVDDEKEQYVLVRSKVHKSIEVASVLPDVIEKFPWAGHLGVHLIDKVLPVLERSNSTLIFTNTRSQCEIWYQALLLAKPDLAGIIAMHHGSISAEIRSWVEDALHEGKLKVVVCTSSLDLGVDFSPVDTVLQIGGPKGVARFLQRAGRSGHQPGAWSHIYFVPTHSLELIEASALREAVKTGLMEERPPIIQAYDVLIQYLLTLAVSEGFQPDAVFEEIKQTFAYKKLNREEFDWMLRFITTGGESLYAYEEYKKVEIEDDGTYKINSRKIATQHRLSIGTIVGDKNLMVKYLKGGKIGTVEESFISQLKPGDVFWFAGRSLELIRIHHMEVLVKRSKNKKGKVPRWMGARMPLSSQMAQLLRSQLDDYLNQDYSAVEIRKLLPMFELQQRLSAIPRPHECLMESIYSREGHHLFVYPFEGRVVHEILATLMAWRISQLLPISFSIAMNDYGFELLADQEIPLQEALEAGIFSIDNLDADITHSINETEMAVRRFREIARISGLVFEGYPGRGIKSKHLQASTALLFKVFEEHDPENLLLKQAYREVIDYQIDGARLSSALSRLDQQEKLITSPERFTPFCFPIMVDRLRERLSSEKLIDRVARMQVQLERQL